MKIVVATPLYPPDSGGPATYAHILYEHLGGTQESGEGKEARDTVVLVKFSEVRAQPRLLRHAVYFWKVLKAARAADLVLALDPVSTGLPAMLAARILGKPFVVKIVGDYAWEQGKQRFGISVNLDEFVRQERVPFAVACFRVIQTLVASSATRIIVPSQYLKEIVCMWGISSKKISVIYNSIRLPEHLRNMPEESIQKGTIVTAGRLVPWKGIDGVIDAVADVRANGMVDAPTLTVIGEGPDREVLEEKGVEQLGKAITFTGLLSHDKTLETMAASHLFILNSTYEGLSHILIEALSLGCAIIATNAGGNPELIEDKVTGLLVPVGDREALGRAITQLLSDDSLVTHLRTEAKKYAEQFSVSKMIHDTRALFAEVCGKSPL